jgi:selenocysteine-specific elongation factor
MIITLAGHVDHGKTTLVQALTGVDTDRLAEEKARGLTIDLGFAYTDKLGFVDVPGHQKFIHNMVAGVAAQQHALLVIAADDGPMPQSREHLEILTLMGLSQGTLVITKCDLVDDARLAQCQGEIEALVDGTFLQGAPVFQTHAQDPDCYGTLLGHLEETAAAQEKSLSDGSFRLAIDRGFTIKGAGVVVTGTVHCGSVNVGDQLFHFPSGKELRVRSMHVQNHVSDVAKSGDRCALNIVGLSLDDVKRGHWLSANPSPGFSSVSIKMDRAPSFPRALKHWMPVHVYHATSHSTGRLALYTEAPENQTWAEIVCDEPLACHRGDRLVIRDQALDATLGGGEVLFTQDLQARRRNTQQHRNLVADYALPSPDHSFAALLNRGALLRDQFRGVWNVSDTQLQTLEDAQPVLKVGDRLMTPPAWQQLKELALAQIEAAGSATAKNLGANSEEGRLARAHPEIRRAVLAQLLQEQRIEQSGGLYRIPNRDDSLPPDLQALWDTLEHELDQMQAPSSGDLAKRLNRPLAGLEKQLIALTKHGKLIHLGAHRFYLPTRLQSIADVVRTMVDRHGSLTVKAFRDQTGIGRNVAIEVLEYFDGKGFTRRQGNERVILRPMDFV